MTEDAWSTAPTKMKRALQQKSNEVFILKITKVFAVLAITLLFCDGMASTGAQLVIDGEGIIVYSGPSVKYRAIGITDRGQKLPVSLQKIPGYKEVGDFYKVLVKVKPGNRKRLGYISSSEQVRIEHTSEDENIDSYQDFLLAKSAVQLAFAVLNDKNYQVALGYLIYPLPNLYLKAFVGQALSLTRASFLAGIEVGVDYFIGGPWSAYLSFAPGMVFSNGSDQLFLGSKPVTQVIQGGAGLRYNAGEHAALSFGLLQAGYFNTATGVLLSGMMITLEVGL